MTVPKTSVAASSGELLAAAGHREPSFEELMRRPGATLDNLGAGVDWDGARCGECRAPLPDDGTDLCGECTPCVACDETHPDPRTDIR